MGNLELQDQSLQGQQLNIPDAMKVLLLTVTVLFLAVLDLASQPVAPDGNRITSINELPKNKYYLSDYMPADYKICYGTWKPVSSSGGFDGNGFTLDFDELSLKANGIFALSKNDTLKAFGKMVLVKNKEMLNCKFVFDRKANLELANDNEKYLIFSHYDTLNLMAPCCDRYNIKLARVK